MALVLVVDDEPGIRRTVRRILEHAGHTVLEAEDGRVGLRVFYEAMPNLVIVDLLMPDKEGIETIREMRAAKSEAKIIAMSGGGMFGIGLLEGLEEFGASCTLAKPFRRDELLRAVQQALGSRPATRG